MSSTTAADRPRPLAGRTALVTGASRGIGMECARILHDAGARLVLLARDLDAMAALGKSLGAPPVISCHKVDLGVPEALAAVLQDVRRSLPEPPDIVVSAAARFTLRPAHEIAADDFAAALQVNLAAHFAIVREFLPDMKARRRGHVVTIGSLADQVALPGNAAYAATKFAARGLHGVLREELRGSGVRVTLVSPAAVDTAIWADADRDARFGHPPRTERLPPRAVADAVLFALTQPDTVNVDELRLSFS